MTRRFCLLVLFLLAALGVPVPAYAAAATVTIDTALHPSALRVVVGTTVTWRNADSLRHRVRTTSAPVELDSGDLDPGRTWTFTFRTAGTYRYVDHRNEDDSAYWGTVTVSSASSSSAPSAPSPSSSSSSSSSASAPPSGAVRIVDRTFSPSSVRVAAGGSITFANDDTRAHTVTADDGSFDSGVVGSGGRYVRRFAAAGTYGYHCAIHPSMTGTVLVPTPSGSVPAPRAGASAPASARRAVPPAAPPAAPPAGPAGATGAARVRVVDYAFTPARLAVHVGDTVTWVNAGASPHTVSAKDGSFGTSLLAPGAAYRTVARRAGTVTYVCQFHPQMTATLAVLPRGTALPAPAGAATPSAPPSHPAAHSGGATGAAAAGTGPRPAPRGVVAAPRTRSVAATSLWDSPLALWSLGSGWFLLAFLGLAWWRAREPENAVARG